MKIYIDIDNTICHTNGMDYNTAMPNYESIKKVNALFDSGHDIVMWTARGSLSNKSYFDLTYKQLISWNVKFGELRMGKPAYDLLIDDHAINVTQWFPAIDRIKDTIIIIQARCGSSRLPKKVMLPFYNEQTILDIVAARVAKNKYNIPICIATTTDASDDVIYEKYKDTYLCFRGSNANVLSRFIECAEFYGKKYIVRICSDNPFLSLSYLDNIIDVFLQNESVADYVSYSVDSIPCIKTHLGLFAEMVTLSSLKIASTSCETRYLENVTNYVYENSEGFAVILKPFPVRLSSESLRLTLDTKDDFDYLSEIYHNIDTNNDINLYEILHFLNFRPDIIDRMKLNIGHYPKI